MTAPRWTAAILPAVVALTPLACDKSTPPTAAPDAGAAPPTSSAAGAVAQGAGPAQDPEPVEIARGRHEVLLGRYQNAIDLLTPVYTDLKAREQFRAGGLAGAWLAVAHAQIVFENGTAPAAHAAAMADKTGDGSLEAAAKLARGALLLAEGDAAAASQALAAAALAQPNSPEAVLALVWDGEALIGTAFGGGRTLVKPTDLDAAKQAYSSAATAAANTGDEKDALMGRAKEGLAAVADYQKDKAALCTHVFASIDHYNAAGAAPFMVAGPSELAAKYKCKP